MARRALIDGYLAQLRQALWSSSPFKNRLLQEIEDHLCEAAERERERGAAEEEAQHRAIERFGLPRVVAPLLMADLAPRRDPMRRGGLMEQAQRVVRHARDEAERRDDTEVGTEHLLLGLLREEESCAVIALAELGVSTERIRAEVEARMPPCPGGPREGMRLTSATEQVLAMADEEAEAFDLYFTSTEHLLLGLIREREGLAAQALAAVGVDLDRARAKVGEVFGRWTEITTALGSRREAGARIGEAER